MAGERLQQVPVEAQNQKTQPKAGEPVGLRTEDKNVKTYTDPSVRENAAGLTESVGNVTAPVQIVAGLALVPFTAGLSGVLIGSGLVDYAGNGYMKSDQQASRDKRLLQEAASNNHRIVVKEMPRDPSSSSAALHQDSHTPGIALKPGYVEIIKHDASTGVTEVNVNHYAFPHEGTVFVSKGQKKEAAVAA